MSWFWIVALVLVLHGIVLSVFVILERRHPMATIAWIAMLVGVPLLGAFFYYIFGRVRFVRRRRLRSRSLRHLQQHRPVLSSLQNIPEEVPADEDTTPGTSFFPGTVISTDTEMPTEKIHLPPENTFLPQTDHLKTEPHSVFATEFSQSVARELPASQQPNLPLISLAQRAAEAPLSAGNTAIILQDAQHTYDCIEQEIRAATHHIHVLFYIIRDDQVGRRFRDLLVEQAKQKIEVRLLCDGLGSYSLPTSFWQPLRESGGQVDVFLPVHLIRWLSHHNINFRNHRKLVIVDGKVGILGGINLGEEYLGQPPHPHWRDTHVCIRGPAVHFLQQTFAEDWCYITKEMLLPSKYYPRFARRPGTDCVQIIPSGPDRDWYPIHLLFFLSITSAFQRIWIATPYFIPDNAITTALITAAMRGLDVKILLPAQGDSALVHYAMRSYYKRLLRAGAEIYEYQKGMMHAKTIVVDGRFGSIGSANLDIRSFHLNFELNAFVYSQDFAHQLETAFQQDIQHAQRITWDDFRKRPFREHIYEAVARVLSPLL